MFNRDRAEKFLRWAHQTFGECALRREERALRLLEEAMELAQAEGVSEYQSRALSTRVWSRERGETSKEVGQVQATLETLCANIGLDPDELGAKEWERVQSKPAAHWKARHDAKTDLGITTDSL